MERDLDNLIENPREDLNCELKEWLDLQQNVVRASIARHLAALANHGGGYLIFGFSDDLEHAPNRPASLDSYSQDVFAGIVKHYLTPTFQCGVEFVPHRNGQKFPVVRVPGHGRVPVCAKAGGPQDDKGREQGIKKGSYYIRKPGPESAPVEGAEDWEPLIRRCVINDRDRLLGDITALIQVSEKPAPAALQRLADWHRNGEERFLQLLSQAQRVGWPVAFRDHCYQLSYLISADEDENLPRDSLCQILEEVNNEVRDTVWTGWSMFYPLSGTEFASAIHPENPDGTGDDVLEANLISQPALPEFWRIALDGKATLVRAYREDRGNNVSASNQRAGTWLSPETVVRETAEIVTHARLLARRLETATRVSFRFTWLGLEKRELQDFDPRIYLPPGYIARANVRTTEGEWAVPKLAADWPNVVAELACPVLHLFGFATCSPEFVKGMAPKFVKL